MNILLINQPTNNRGDEAAHKSLVRALNGQFPNAQITVLFQSIPQNSIDQMKVESPRNQYVNIHINKNGTGLAKKWSLRLGNPKLAMLHPLFYAIAKYIKNADVVVSAPGGICMGLFQNWEHIYLLSLALSYNKRIAYYSRSFGPFPIETKWNRIFKRISYDLLNKFDFISIRDAKTMCLANEIGISYIPSIDTAFLDAPRVQIPKHLSVLLDGKEYIVFVPNSLTWHIAFKNIDTNYLSKFYVGIMEMILLKYEDANIVMLPQLFNRGNKGDEYYFRQLKDRINNDRVIVIPETCSSDIQQTIISKAKLMIGARYHSVVFAINNAIPFVALSYEHKISGLLEILGLQQNLFNIEVLRNEMINIEGAIYKIEKIIDCSKPSLEAKLKARKIAKNCMNLFIQKYT